MGAYSAGPKRRKRGAEAAQGLEAHLTVGVERLDELAGPAAHRAPGPPVARHHGTEQGVRAVAVDDLHDELAAHPGQDQHRGVRLGDLARRAGDALEGLVLVRAREQQRADLLARSQPVLARPGVGVELGVLDRDGGRGGEGEHDVDVGVLELGLLVGQVQVPEDLLVHAHRGAEERAHGRVARREALEGGVVAQVLEAQHPVVGDLAEHAHRVGGVGEHLRRGLRHAILHEGGRGALRVEHVDRRVLGVRELRGDLHEALQHARELEVRAEREDRPQQLEGALAVHACCRGQGLSVVDHPARSSASSRSQASR